MKFISRITLLLVCAFTIGSVQAKTKKNEIYAFAVATSFNDSVVYITSINHLDFATTDKKTDFLNHRMAYSNQFKLFLDKKFQKDHISALFFSKKKESLEKKYIKLRRKYQKDKETKFVEIPVTDFKFYKYSESEE